MKARALAGLQPVIVAFAIWFLQFMLCWAAGEVWPHQWPANALAWVVTVLALLALAWHFVRVNAERAAGRLPAWHHRAAQGATAIAMAAVLFSGLPSLVFLP
jgi:hypothetical protein